MRHFFRLLSPFVQKLSKMLKTDVCFTAYPGSLLRSEGGDSQPRKLILLVDLTFHKFQLTGEWAQEKTMSYYT